MRAEQKIKVPVQCYGITLIDNDIVLGNKGVRYSDIFNLHVEKQNVDIKFSAHDAFLE